MVNFEGEGPAERAEALARVPSGLWREVARAPRSVLMLDYDGTLAPFTVDPDEALVPERAMQSLQRLAAGTRTTVAIVSGRRMRDLERFLGVLPITLVGEHGWDRRTPEGQVEEVRLSGSVEAAIDAAERAARALGWGGCVERKRTSVVLHTRRLPPARAEDLRERCATLWQCVARGAPIAVDRIDGGVEFRAKRNNKGTVVRSLLSDRPSGTLGVFVGDDTTDEQAFEAVRASGFGVRVGNSMRPTFAAGHLPDPFAVTLFLEKWLRAITPEPTAP